MRLDGALIMVAPALLKIAAPPSGDIDDARRVDS